MTTPRRFRRFIPALLLLVPLGVFGLSHRTTMDRTQAASNLADACGSPNPYLVTTRFVDGLHGVGQADRPVLFAFRDTPGDDPAELARIYADIAVKLGCPPESFWGGRQTP